jgi:hypothetical protein
MGVIKHKIIKERGLLVQQYSGKFSKNDLAIYFTGLYENPDYLHVSAIYSDFSHAKVSLSEDDLEEIAYFIITHAPKVRHVINAILVNEPLVTAYSFLYKEVMKQMPMYECHVFSTFKEAAKYIGYKPLELEDIIREAYL